MKARSLVCFSVLVVAVACGGSTSDSDEPTTPPGSEEPAAPAEDENIYVPGRGLRQRGPAGASAVSGSGVTYAPVVRFERRNKFCGAPVDECRGARFVILDIETRMLETHECALEGGPSSFGANLGEVKTTRTVSEDEIQRIHVALGELRRRKDPGNERDGAMETLELTTASGAATLSPSFRCGGGGTTIVGTFRALDAALSF